MRVALETTDSSPGPGGRPRPAAPGRGSLAAEGRPDARVPQRAAGRGGDVGPGEVPPAHAAAPRTSRSCRSRRPTARMTVPAAAFVDTIARVARAASRDETRPHLTGVLVTASGNELRMVATDSYRLGVKETKLERQLSGSLEANVPARTLQELGRIAVAGGAETIGVAALENQVVFTVDDVVLSSRLVEGRFPNYQQLLPEAYEHELRVSRDELLEVVRRVGLLAQKNAPLRLRFSEGALDVSAQTPDVGEASESLPVPFAGEALEIGFNPEFFREGLESAESEELILKLISPLRPGLIQSGRRGRGLPLPRHADPPERVGRACASRASSCATSATTRRRRSSCRDGPRPWSAGPNGAGKTNLLEARLLRLHRRARRAPPTSASWSAAAATVWRGWCSTWRDDDGEHRLEVGFQPGEAKHLRVDGSRCGQPVGTGRAPARERLPAGAARARQGRPRRPAALTSTRSWPRSGRPARRRAAPTRARSRSATPCSARIRAGAGGPGRARRLGRRAGARRGSQLMEDRARGRRRPAAAVRASSPRSLGLPGEAELRYRPRSAATDADGARRRAGRAPRGGPRARLHRPRAAPRRAPAAARRARRCARTARRASSASRCSRCCSPSARCWPSAAAARR